jgi:predicted MPP superfamily phosphohydrolase
MYDLIGDIHGHADELKQLLEKMNYRHSDGCWRHPSRKVIFVGDFIDRGRSIREVLHLVKAMVDNGQAVAVMGNHEYNAIAFNRKKSDGSFLRPHNPKNIKQHKETLEQFADYRSEWEQWIEWFYTLPLFLDLKQLRVVHACWAQEHIDRLGERTEGKLTESLLLEAHQKGSAAYTMVEDTLKNIQQNQMVD